MAWVAIEVFSVVTESFWFCVVTMDSVVTGCSQGQEALCRDTEIVSRQGGVTGAH